MGGLYLKGQFNGGFFALLLLRGLYMEGIIFGILRYFIYEILFNVSS